MNGPLPEADIPRSSAYYRAAFKDHLYDMWERHWKSDPAFARQSRIWFGAPSFRKSRALLGENREEFSRAVRWLTGFAFLRAPNAARGTSEQDICRLCATAPEKADHILLTCPTLNQLRWECFGAFQIQGSGFEWEVSSLLKFLSNERIKSLEDPEEDAPDPPAGNWDSEDDELR